MKHWIVTLALGLVLAACSESEEHEPLTPSDSDSSTEASTAVTTDSFSDAQICKGVIATVMGRSPSIMSTRAQGDHVIVSYQRESDGSEWETKCRVDTDTATWGDIDGRWRDTQFDPEILISVSNDSTLIVEERYNDGSSREKEFSADQL